jgi:hypothetical protein
VGGREFIDETVRRLAVQQDLVANRVGMLTDAGWESGPGELALERLVGLGHFPDYPGELDWGPREIVGHLRDSARIFRERVARLRTHDRPSFNDFDTTAGWRIGEYRSAQREDLVAGLERAQGDLREALRGVQPDELDRVGVHETEGEVTLRDILAFLPDHQEDHAEQLGAVTAQSLA